MKVEFDFSPVQCLGQASSLLPTCVKLFGNVQRDWHLAMASYFSKVLMKDRRNKVQLMENVACDVMLCSPVLRGEKSIDSDVVGKGVRSQLINKIRVRLKLDTWYKIEVRQNLIMIKGSMSLWMIWSAIFDNSQLLQCTLPEQQTNRHNNKLSYDRAHLRIICGSELMFDVVMCYYCLLLSCAIISPKGRMASPKLMNFRKSSKRPLIFGKSCCAFCDKSAYVQYGGTVVYYMILFPMRCM